MIFSALIRAGRGPSGYLTKTVRVMKMTAIILLAGAMQVSASATSQNITFEGRNAKLTAIFSVIEQQTGYLVVANKKQVGKASPVTINAENMPLVEFMSKITEGQPLIFSIEGNTIFIREKDLAVGPRPLLEANAPPVTGMVRGVDGQPLAGVNIIVKGTKRGTTSNADGTFSIDAKEWEVLIISSIGYSDKQIIVGSTQTVGVIELSKSESKLDEVQIIAYGQTSKRLNTSNVSTVKAEEISRQPVNNPLLALQGRVPGVFIEQSTGLPGSGVKIKIQGTNSITNGSDPLYVIDGVPFTSQLLPSVSGSLDGNGSPLHFINPLDIESIDILKDADATSIYGSRAANGAVLITTKKGKAGKTRLNLNVQNGFGKVTRRIDLMNTEQYLEMRKKAFVNDNINLNEPPYNSPGFLIGVAPDLSYWNQNAYTDWQKELIGGTAQYKDYTASISGGNSTTSFIVGGTFHKETTVFPTDYNDSKGSLHFNLNNTSLNQKFRFSLSANYLYDDNRLPGIGDLTATAMLLPPNAPSLYNPDGTYNWGMFEVDGTQVSTWTNPLALMNTKYNVKTHNLISSANIGYEIISGLNFDTRLGYTSMQSDGIQVIPSSTIAPDLVTGYERKSLFQYNKINSWIIEPQLSYKKTLGGGSLELLLGSTFQNNAGNGIKLDARGFNSDLVMEDIKSAATVTPMQDQGSTIYQYRYNALFGRINYNYRNTYLLNFSARRDGSSRFGPENKFNNFASAGAAWIFTNEKTIVDHLRFLSFGKIKMSYGTTGNDQIRDYRYLSLYTPVSSEIPYQNDRGMQVTGLNNPYLQWEETRKLSVGLDLGFFHDRLLLTANYNQNRSSNQLVSSPLPATTGFTVIDENLAAEVQNTGWEFSLNAVNVKTKNFTWSSSINFTLPKNKLLSFPDLENSGYKENLIVGQQINITRVFHLLGVNPATGLYEYEKADGTITSTPDFSTDRIAVIKNRDNPEFYGGFHNSVKFKSFELNFLISFVKQTGPTYALNGAFPGSFSNQPASVLKAWNNPGDIATMQRYITFFDFNNYLPLLSLKSSDAIYGDASYARLKNVSLSWQLPQNILAKARIENARVYVQGQNLLTITNYDGLDPENRSSSFLPPLTMLTFGIQVSL